jgi:DNA-binding response OmpR family regulator
MLARTQRILIVDDDEDYSQMQALHLDRSGSYTTRQINDATKAFAAACEFEPDLILLDVNMPALDGGGVVNQLRADERTKRIPVIFLTVLVDPSEVPFGGLLSGGQLFLSKPTNWLELHHCIGSALSHQQIS